MMKQARRGMPKAGQKMSRKKAQRRAPRRNAGSAARPLPRKKAAATRKLPTRYGKVITGIPLDSLDKFGKAFIKRHFPLGDFDMRVNLARSVGLKEVPIPNDAAWGELRSVFADMTYLKDTTIEELMSDMH